MLRFHQCILVSFRILHANPSLGAHYKSFERFSSRILQEISWNMNAVDASVVLNTSNRQIMYIMGSLTHPPNYSQRAYLVIKKGKIGFKE